MQQQSSTTHHRRTTRLASSSDLFRSGTPNRSHKKKRRLFYTGTRDCQKTAERRPRPRLKSRGEDGTRPDWRRTALKRLELSPPDQDVRSMLKQQREDLRRDHYETEVPSEHFHRRATSGETLVANTNRTREDEVTLHQLRLNRWRPLQQTIHRFAKADSHICTFCAEEESTEHFLFKCSRWQEGRKEIVGSFPSVNQLQETPRQHPNLPHAYWSTTIPQSVNEVHITTTSNHKVT